MKLSTICAIAALGLVGTVSLAQAQSTAPVTNAVSNAAAMTKSKAADAATAAKSTAGDTGKAVKNASANTSKTSISKACSLQADQKGLKGKERKKFRSSCKHNNGVAPAQ